MTTLQPLPATATATTQTGSPALVTTTGLPDLELRDPALAEAAAWSALGAAARARASRLEELCQSISAAGRGQTARAVERCAHLAGVSPAQMQRLYCRWKTQGRMGLVNRNKAKPLTVFATPAAFREEWKKRQLQAQRGTSMKGLWKALLRQLEAWERGDNSQAIPGYASPPKRDRRTGLPPGWIYQTLSRIQPTDAEKARSRQGAKAASIYLPSVRTSREGVPVLGCVMFDDEHTDVDTSVGGQRQPTRPLAFHALDFRTGFNLFRSYMPVILGEDGTKQSLTKDYFYWIVAEHLCSRGYRTCDHGTVLVVEHGTAAIGSDSKKKNPLADDPELEQRIHALTGGKVRIDRSGIYSEPAARGLLYPGPSSGNPRYKAPLEVFFRLLREETAVRLLNYDGHTGRKHELKPEELPAIERAHAWWMKLAESMPQSHRELLASNILSWREFVQIAHRIIEAMNDRTDHHLQQWEACGFMGWEALSPSNQWLRAPADHVQSMPRVQLDMAIQMGFLRTGRLSPREALHRELSTDRQHIRRISRRSYAALLPQCMAREVKVSKRGEFVIEDWRLNGADPLIYIARARTQDGLEIVLNREETYQVWLNPFHPDVIQVCHAFGSRKGAAIGECVRTIPAAKTDNDALARQSGIVSSFAFDERENVNRAMEARAVRRQSAAKWNQIVAEDAKQVRSGKPSRWSSPDVQSATDAMDDLLDSRAELQPATADATYDPLEPDN